MTANNADTATTANYTLPALAYGTYQFYATCTNVSTSNVSETRTFTFALPPPLLVNFTDPTPASGTTLTGTSMAVNVTVSENATGCNLTLNLTAYAMSVFNADAATHASSTVTSLTDGFYVYHVNCSGASGASNYTETRNVTVALPSSAVTLNSPANASSTTSSTMTFSFTAVDNLSATLNCSLNLDGAVNQTDASVANDTPTNFVVTGIPLGQHTWSVNCTNGADKTTASEQRTFTRSAPSSTSTSGGGEPAPVLAVSLNATCGGYSVTVEKDWAALSDAMVISSSGSTETITYTNANGQASFSGCGMNVNVRAAKGGAEGLASAYVECIPCGCNADSDCGAAEACSAGSCVAVQCPCGTVQNHQCIPYSCCLDSDCAAGQSCQDHVCSAVLPLQCSNDSDCNAGETCTSRVCVYAFECASDDQCDAGQYCDISAGLAGGSCKNRTVQPTGCTSDAECAAGEYCDAGACIQQPAISAPGNATAGKNVTVRLTRGNGPCAYCEVTWVSPSGARGRGPTDANGNFNLPITQKGTYKVTPKGGRTISIFAAGPAGTEPGQGTAVQQPQPTSGPPLPLLAGIAVVAVAAAVAYLLLQPKPGK